MLIGDSHTHGRLTFDWPSMLAIRRPDLQFVNAGINGEHVGDVLKRIEPILACDPDYATILLGSNERISSVSCGTALCYGQCCGPKQHDAYRVNLHKLFTILLERTKIRHIMVMCFPPGETFADAPLNIVGAEMIEILREVVGEFQTRAEGRLTYVPLAGKYDHFITPQALGDEPQTTWSPVSFVPHVLSAQFHHYVRGVPIDEIARKRGLNFTTDCIHLNSVGALIIADTVEAFLSEVAPRHAAAVDEAAAAAADTTGAAETSPAFETGAVQEEEEGEEKKVSSLSVTVGVSRTASQPVTPVAGAALGSAAALESATAREVERQRSMSTESAHAPDTQPLRLADSTYPATARGSDADKTAQ
jgi:lysophospholipase L1-like esterase